MKEENEGNYTRTAFGIYTFNIADMLLRRLMTKNKMRSTCSTHGKQNLHTKSWLENLTG